MAKKLTTAQLDGAKAWVHDTLILGGIKDKASTARKQRYYWETDWEISLYKSSRAEDAAKKIWETVMYRKLDNINADFETLSDYSFTALSGDKKFKKSASMLATYVAWFCDINNIYWDNSVLSEFEMKEFLSTYLGQALQVYDCFTTSLLKSTTSVASTGSRSTKVASGAKIVPTGKVGELSASIAYTEPLSPWVRDLVSTAGTKEHPTGSYMFRIEGINAHASKVVPTVFIRPLTPSGKTGTTNKVFMGSSNGRTDCTVYFNTLSDANTFLTECNTHGIIPATISTVHVVKRPIDSNGYYKVNTEFGNVYISAKKLKEALTENPKEEESKEATIEESAKKEEREFDSFAFTDNLMKEI